MGKKRAPGEGYVRQRKDGLWEAGSARDVFGKRIVAYGATQRIAIRKRDQKIKDREAGLVVDAARLTLAGYLRDWLTHVIQRERSPKTHESYQSTIEHHIIPYFGTTLKLRDLTEAHIDPLIAKLHGAGLTRTVGYVRDILRSALNVAVSRGLIPRNPASTIAIPKRAKTKAQRPFSEEDAARFLDALEGHPHGALLRLILSLGLRRGEALAIRDADLHLDAGYVVLSANVQRVHGRVQRLDGTKGDADPVTMPLSPRLVEVLRAHLVERDRMRDAQIKRDDAREAKGLPRLWRDHGLVFPSGYGTPIEPRNLLTRFKAVLVKAGLDDKTRLHDLRHSCAAFLIAQGEHPRIIMEILRHKQISTTMEIYGHVESPLQRTALDGIETRLAAKQKPSGRSGGGSDAGSADGAKDKPQQDGE